MKLLRLRHPPPDFGAICDAFRAARQEPATAPFLRVGILNDAGELAATGYLDGPFQANALGGRLADLGYLQRSQGTAVNLRLCDVLFVPPDVRGRESAHGELEAS